MSKRKYVRRKKPKEEKLSGTTSTADILCPFFGAHSKKSIRCTDIYPGTDNITTLFVSEEEKKFHQHTYCEGNYKKCWLYCEAMDLMWDE